MPEKSVSDPTDLRRNSTTSDRENCVRTETNCKKKLKRNEIIKKTKKQKKKEGATILDLSSFFLLTPSHLENLDNLNVIDGTHWPIDIYIIG